MLTSNENVPQSSSESVRARPTRGRPSPNVPIDEAFAARFLERFEREDPDARYKRERRITRRDLVARSYNAIVAKRNAGFTFEGIAAHFANLGAPIGVATLKTYMQDLAAKARANVVTEPRRDGATVHGKTRRNTAPKDRASSRRQQPADATAEGHADAEPGSRKKMSGAAGTVAQQDPRIATSDDTSGGWPSKAEALACVEVPKEQRTDMKAETPGDDQVEQAQGSASDRESWAADRAAEDANGRDPIARGVPDTATADAVAELPTEGSPNASAVKRAEVQRGALADAEPEQMTEATLMAPMQRTESGSDAASDAQADGTNERAEARPPSLQEAARAGTADRDADAPADAGAAGEPQLATGTAGEAVANSAPNGALNMPKTGSASVGGTRVPAAPLRLGSFVPRRH